MVFISPDHKAGYFWGGLPLRGVVNRLTPAMAELSTHNIPWRYTNVPIDPQKNLCRPRCWDVAYFSTSVDVSKIWFDQWHMFKRQTYKHIHNGKPGMMSRLCHIMHDICTFNYKHISLMIDLDKIQEIVPWMLWEWWDLISPVSVKTIVSVISFWKRQKSKTCKLPCQAPSKDTLLFYTPTSLPTEVTPPENVHFETWTRSSQNEREYHLPSIHLHDFKIQNPWVFGSVWPNICWPPFFDSKTSPLLQLPKEKLDMKLEISRMILVILQIVWFDGF